jgi:hypothetical protein
MELLWDKRMRLRSVSLFHDMPVTFTAYKSMGHIRLVRAEQISDTKQRLSSIVWRFSTAGRVSPCSHRVLSTQSDSLSHCMLPHATLLQDRIFRTLHVREYRQ